MTSVMLALKNYCRSSVKSEATDRGAPEQRFRSIMSEELTLAQCVVCGSKSFSRCSRCHDAYYCTKEHQRQDWKRHKANCRRRDNDVNNSAVDDLCTKNQKITKGKDSAHTAGLTQTSAQTLKQTECQNNVPSKSEIKLKSNTSNSITFAGKTNITNCITNKCESRLSDSLSGISRVVHAENDYSGAGAITFEGSSENEILSASTQQIISTDFPSSTSTVLKAVNRTFDPKMPVMSECVVEPPRSSHKDYPEGVIKGNPAPFCHNKNSFIMDQSDPYYTICQRVIRDMTAYGVCVLDNFLGHERGLLVLKEVLGMYQSGIFQAGQLVSNPGSTEAQTIRSDRITWIDGRESHCSYIGYLIQQVDNIILRANKMPQNGKMGNYVIKGRTKAMVACYPGSGSHYVKHVDNPNRDGRCITAIYYLNLDWDVDKCGGLLRVFPEGYENQVADIAPNFDRMLFFWSDRRNPHEVQPAFDTRYAITLWYFDAHEREEATRRYREKHLVLNMPSTSKS